jgi:hypothetical protein
MRFDIFMWLISGFWYSASDIKQSGMWLPSNRSRKYLFIKDDKSKALSMIVDALRYVPNTVIRRDLQIPTVIEEIRRYTSQYSARLSAHPNGLVVKLMEQPDNNRRCIVLPVRYELKLYMICRRK